MPTSALSFVSIGFRATIPLAVTAATVRRAGNHQEESDHALPLSGNESLSGTERYLGRLPPTVHHPCGGHAQWTSGGQLPRQNRGSALPPLVVSAGTTV